MGKVTQLSDTYYINALLLFAGVASERRFQDVTCDMRCVLLDVSMRPSDGVASVGELYATYSHDHVRQFRIQASWDQPLPRTGMEGQQQEDSEHVRVWSLSCQVAQLPSAVLMAEMHCWHLGDSRM